MKISEARKVQSDDGFNLVEIRRNPSNTEEYIAILYRHNGKSFMLAYENDTVLSSPDLEHITLMLKDIGLKKAKVYF
ncbi:Uncharacterised protein [Halioglobus japonicus]|nr:Uncharacterised protein [Halioglobus japonicus]